MCAWCALNEQAPTTLYPHLFAFNPYKYTGNLLLVFLKEKGFVLNIQGKEKYLAPENTLTYDPFIWNHVCIAWEYGDSILLYLNGTIRKTIEVNYYFAKINGFKGKFALGQDVDNGIVNEKQQGFQGNISQFFMYNRKLSIEEIKSTYQKHPPNDSMVSWSDFKNKANGASVVEMNFTDIL